MGNLFRLLAYLFIILFFAGVCWLAYGSYQHMKNMSLHSNVENTDEVTSDTADETMADASEFDDEDEFIDDDEDLLEDDEVDELLAADDVLDEIEHIVKETEEGTTDVASNVKDKLGDHANSLASAGTAALNNAETEASEIAGKAKTGISEATEKAKAGVSEFTEKSTKTVEQPDRKNIPEEYGKAINRSPKDLYFVITGSFTVAENAENEVKAMRKKGYADAETVQFASTKYLSVCVGRFGKRADAEKMVAKIKKDAKLDAYVHKRRMK